MPIFLIIGFETSGKNFGTNRQPQVREVWFPRARTVVLGHLVWVMTKEVGEDYFRMLIPPWYLTVCLAAPCGVQQGMLDCHEKWHVQKGWGVIGARRSRWFGGTISEKAVRWNQTVPLRHIVSALSESLSRVPSPIPMLSDQDWIWLQDWKFRSNMTNIKY